MLGALLAERVRAFCVFAEELNFTRAADRLYITQPALHKKIAALQDQLGIPLYVTNPKSKQVEALTPQGRRLAAYGEDAAKLALDALGGIVGTKKGPVTVAAGRGAYLYVIPKAIRKLAKREGGVRILAANNAEAIDHVRGGRADIGVTAFSHPPKDLRSTSIATYPQTLVVANSHRLADRTSLTTGDLDGIELALPQRGERMREYIGDSLQAAGVHVTVSAEALNWDLLVQFVTFGIEATIVNEFVPLPRGLTRIPVADLQPATYYAIWRDERASIADDLLKMFHHP